MKRTPLKRTDGFYRGTPELVAAFRDAVVGPYPRCIMAGKSKVACVGKFDPCHVLSKRALRRRGLSEEIVYDARNGVCGCRRHHRRSDDGIEPFPRELLPDSALAFAEELGLSHLIDRHYGEDSQPTKGTDLSAA